MRANTHDTSLVAALANATPDASSSLDADAGVTVTPSATASPDASPPYPTPNAKPPPVPNPAPASSLTGIPPPLPGTSSSIAGPVAAGLFLALLAVAALVMARRRRGAARLVEILETASLGPRRALVVARLGDELLVLGSSEGGVTLLSSRPAAGLVAREAPLPSTTPASAPSPLRAVLAAFSRLRRRPATAPAFERLLTESVEDVELRRKLAEGGVGSVRSEQAARPLASPQRARAVDERGASRGAAIGELAQRSEALR